MTTDHIISMDNTDFGKDVDNMCNLSLNVEQEGIRKGRAEGRAEGLAEGREEGIKILIDSLHAANMIRDAVKNMVKEGYSLTEAEINKYMDIYWPA